MPGEPTGYGLQRALKKAGDACQVVAPSLIPVQSGNRVKTDRRDAAKLAHFLRSCDLTPVTIPDTVGEALRDLERSRNDAKRAQQVARHQLSKFLLRRELRFHEGRNQSKICQPGRPMMLNEKSCEKNLERRAEFNGNSWVSDRASPGKGLAGRIPSDSYEDAPNRRTNQTRSGSIRLKRPTS